ncbi:MFS transporter, partial [Pectobacterium brasiliense]|uniref:MFS transporter n=1 Tax=Pectobacterium brasiliense TaxID=180957 RepID=UPI00196905D8
LIGICVKMGFSRPFRLALMVVIVIVMAYAALYFANLSEDLTIFVLFAITSVFVLRTGGIYYIPWTVYTFLADVDEVLTGRRREGIYAGAMTFAGKMVRYVIVFAMGWTLSQLGFVS